MIDIRVCTARLLKERFQIEETTTVLLFEEGIINEPSAKRVLIREEYYNKIGNVKKIIIKNELAEKYCVSLPCVEKIILKI